MSPHAGDARCSEEDRAPLRSAGLSDDTSNDSRSNPSGFTAINPPVQQGGTSQSLASGTVLQPPAKRGRRHNPAIAQYLGLGANDEPAHLTLYAPVSGQTDASAPRSARKRRKFASKHSDQCVSSQYTGDNIAPHVQQSHHDLVVNTNLQSSRKPAECQTPTQWIGSTTQETACPQTTSRQLADPQLSRLESDTKPTRTMREGTVMATYMEIGDPPEYTNSASGTRAYPIDLCDTTISSFDAESITLDDCDLDFDGGVEDEDLLILSSEMDEVTFAEAGDSVIPQVLPSTQPTPLNNGTLFHNDVTTDNDGELEPLNEFRCSSRKLTNRKTSLTPAAVAPVRAPIEIYTPIVRSPFPTPVQDRSPVIGLSSNMLLRTCFRIGEAINQSCQASKSDKHILFELYAKVIKSERTDTSQIFVLGDIFHDKAPCIKGVYDSVIWKSVQLFEYDSRCLLQTGSMCRCIGTMKRNGKEWLFTVLNIWKASWEDIRWVEGIVNS